MEDFSDFFVKPVAGHPDTFVFRHDFLIEGKSLAGDAQESVIEQDNGDLIIEGWAASFEGLDRQGENFVEGAFTRGLKAFLNGGSALCFEHQSDKGIGSVLDLKEIPGKGLWLKARVDFQPESSPLRYIYNAVKKGSYKGLSVGGFFKRALVNGRQMIQDIDFTEVSVTPVAMHPKTQFAVVAGKALSAGSQEELPEMSDDELNKFRTALDDLESAFGKFKAQE